MTVVPIPSGPLYSWSREAATVGVDRIVNFTPPFTAFWDEELARDREKFFESFNMLPRKLTLSSHVFHHGR